MALHGLRFWGGISAALHVLVGILLLFKLPGREIPAPQEAIPVELVTPDLPQIAQAPQPLPNPAPPAPEPEPNPTTTELATPEPRPAPPAPPPPPPPPPPAPAPAPAPPAPTPPAPAPAPAPPAPPAPTPPAPAQAPTPPLPMPPPPAPAPPAAQAELAPAQPEPPRPTPPQPQQQAPAPPSPPLPVPPPPAPAPPAPPAPAPAPPRPTPAQPSTTPPPPQPSQQAGTGRTPPPPRTEERSSSVLSTLERLRAAQQQNQPPRARPSEASGRPAQGGGAPNGAALLTAGEVRGVADRISECWSVDAGMLGLDQIVVELRVDIDPNGVIRNVRPASGGAPSEPRTRAVYDSARRALMDQKCSPLPVPREKIPSLNNATFRFNPKGLVR